MIPAKFVRPCKLDGVKGPAILLPTSKHGEPFIVVGTGDAARVCFLGENYRFQAFPQAEGGNWNGIAVEGIEIELELDSAGSDLGTMPGAMIRTGTELQLAVSIRSHGFPESRRVTVQSDLPAGGNGCDVVFTRWRAVIKDGDKVIEIKRVDATPQPE